MFKINKRGFTLVELLAVIVILAIIALIGYSVIGNVLDTSKNESNKLTIREYAKAVEEARVSYLMNTGTDVRGSGILDSSWLTDYVKLEKSTVSCKTVTYLNNVQLSACKVNNSEDIYCYNGEEVNKCNYAIVSGNSIQNGTPSPSTPVEIQSVGDKTKNLLNASLWKTSVTENGLTVEYLEDEDCFLLNGTVTSKGNVAGKYINIPSVPGTSYVLSAKYVSGNIDRTNGSDNKYAVVFFGNADTINTTNNWYDTHLQNQDVTGSVKANDKNYITRFWFYVSPGVKFDNYKVRIQLEEGSIATKYEPYGYKIPIKVADGHNLFDSEIKQGSYAYSSGDYGSNVDYICNENMVEVIPNSNYSISSSTDKKIDGILFYDENKKYISRVKLNSQETFTTPYNAKYINFNIYGVGIQAKDVGNITLKIEESLIYLKEPLRKIGDVADTLDLSSGRITRHIKEYTFTGKETFTSYKYNTELDESYHYYIKDIIIIQNNDLKCNKLVAGNMRFSKENTDTYLTSAYATNGFIYGQFNKQLLDSYTGSTTDDKLKNFYTTEKPKIYYQTINPILEQVDVSHIPFKTGNITINDINTTIKPSKIDTAY